MKSNQAIRIGDSLLQQTAFVLLVWIGAGLAAVQHAKAATNVVIWDTGSRFADAIDVEKRDGWKVVPSELFSLEADPPKAASDPGYYGREYSIKGDAVVENRSLTAVFWSVKGRAVIYSKADATSPSGSSLGKSSLGRKILEFVPLQTKSQPASISRCEILRNAADEVALEGFFSVNMFMVTW